MVKNKFKEQFAAVFDKHLGIVLKISRAYTKTTHDREDLINDIALELWRAFPNYRGDARVSTWIYRIALNVSMNYKRKTKNNLLLYPESGHIELADWLQLEEDNEQTDLLYECIDELDEFNKAIIILYLDGNSHGEIATITGISKTNVGTRISRIKNQIKEIANTKI